MEPEYLDVAGIQLSTAMVHLVAALDTFSGRGHSAAGSAWLRDNGSETNTSAAATNKAPM